MIEEHHLHVYRSGAMKATVTLFLILFSVGLAALVLLGTGVFVAAPPIFLAVGIATVAAGLAVWNMETGIELRPEGLRFTHLVKPAYTVAYSRIRRVSIRMLRGMYYCFMRFGGGLFDGTFFPVGYWAQQGRNETNAFLVALAERANLVQTGRTPLGAPIYERFSQADR